ncbi:protein phosphatase 2C domain-containing protein [Streptomyces platensis]|uniref:protein phosphatase 2C domain-containing protein n=1 Tax=Streptomyces platensis TaxID=58346 RepID=UPI002E802732|nr:protein phosphatase 2C domain-containing protein [Streptomyces platensis]WTI55359.1 protein phosphatase 2C domain-containing protein [Streptomyces platensis]WUB79059.1 protein phosphatase 2C domain-containing protein [Streptomyces platensis]
MNQQGAGCGQEDDWWRQLYGEGGGDDAPGRAAVRDAGPSDAPDTLDARVASALRAVATPRRPAPASQPPPARPASAPSAPIPLQATGPRQASPARPAAPPAPEAPGDTPAPAPTGLPADRPAPSEPELGTLPAADPAALDELVPDTALDGARYGSLTLLAASRRGDLARHRGDVRRDALLTARFGAGRHALILVAVATGRPAGEGAHRAAHEACARIGSAVGRSYTRLAEDIRTDHRSALKSGLQRLTDRSYGRLGGRSREPDAAAERYPPALRCLLLPADPDCRTRVFFGIGAGGLFRLRDGAWEDLEPAVPDLTVQGGADGTGERLRSAAGRSPADGPDRSEPFLFRTAFARPGDTLLLCSAGLAEPLQQEPAFADRLAGQWSAAEPPGLVAFLAAAQLRVAGHLKDRTAVGVWEA